LQDLPAFDDYAMKGRTYRYYQGTPLWGFGYGLSYSTFGYSSLNLSSQNLKTDDPLTVTVKLKNTSSINGAEVTQLYIQPKNAPSGSPKLWLAGFTRMMLKAGEERSLTFTLKTRELGLVNEQGERQMMPGDYSLFVGGSQPSEEGYSGVSQSFQIQ
jgi:beta-glucosidase